jgi:hypothetical protein
MCVKSNARDEKGEEKDGLWKRRRRQNGRERWKKKEISKEFEHI